MRDWRVIEDFPNYEVSNDGRVRNANTGRELGVYDNGHGILQVVMQRGGRSCARAVHRLVAGAFLDPAPDDCVPMHRDNAWENNDSENLQWKPRWFAIRWTRQLRQLEPRDHRRIRHLRSGVVYENALECARAIGGLEDLVILTAQSLWETTYMGSRFEFLDN